jgi:hypothetical protein
MIACCTLLALSVPFEVGRSCFPCRLSALFSLVLSMYGLAVFPFYFIYAQVLVFLFSSSVSRHIYIFYLDRPIGQPKRHSCNLFLKAGLGFPFFFYFPFSFSVFFYYFPVFPLAIYALVVLSHIL